MDRVNIPNNGLLIVPKQDDWKDKAAGSSEGWIDFFVYEDKNEDNVPDGNQIEVVHVKFNKVLTEEEKEEKSPKPVVPQLPSLPEEEPETGDASMIAVVGVAVASAAGLYVVSKKDNDEE